MENLPTEILADISEYIPVPRQQGRYSSIGLPDPELIKRIKRYDPNFDYNEWKRLKDIRLQISNTPDSLLYLYTKKRGIDVRFVDPQDVVHADPNLYPSVRNELAAILNINKDLIAVLDVDFGYTLELGLKNTPMEYDYLVTDIKEEPFSEYNYVIESPCTQPSVPDLIYDLNYAMVTPLTLEEVLSNILEEQNKTLKLRQADLYTFFDNMKHEPWIMEFNDRFQELMIEIYNPNLELQDVSDLIPKLGVDRELNEAERKIIIDFGMDDDMELLFGEGKFSKTRKEADKLAKYFWPLRYNRC